MTSGSVTPSPRSVATTSSPCRRSAVCMASNRASCSGVSQVASSARSPGATRARTCDRNWRTLLAHQEAVDDIREPSEVLAAEDDDRDQDEEAVLGEDRPELPGRLSRQEREQDRPAVERRDRDQVEQPEQ